jgi:hypothetical protein
MLQWTIIVGRGWFRRNSERCAMDAMDWRGGVIGYY